MNIELPTISILFYICPPLVCIFGCIDNGMNFPYISSVAHLIFKSSHNINSFEVYFRLENSFIYIAIIILKLNIPYIRTVLTI